MTAPAVVPASAILDALRLRYTEDENQWIHASELQFEGRRLDFLAMNRWQARGFKIVGFEVKVTRADWLREVTNFEKAAPWLRVCNEFWLAVAPGVLLDVKEVPEGWGVLELRKTRLYTLRHAKVIDHNGTMPREVAMRLAGRLHDEAQRVKRLGEMDARTKLREEVRAEVEAEYASAKKTVLDTHVLDALRDEAAAWARVRGVFAAHGVPIHDWRPYARTVRAAAILAELSQDHNRVTAIMQRIERAASEAEGAFAELRGHMAAAAAKLDATLDPVLPAITA